MNRLLLCAFGIMMWTTVALAQDVCAPAKVSFTVTTGKTTANVEWTNTGDDCNTGTATTYEIRRSTSSFDDSSWQSATLIATGSVSGGNGSSQCHDFSSLPCATTYYWAVFLIDEAGNRSPISTVVQQATQSCDSNLEVAC